MAVRYRSTYRRYLWRKRLRLLLTLVGAVVGLFICYFMYNNLVHNGFALGRKEILPMLLVMAASVALPWLTGSLLLKKPSEL